MQRNLSFWGGLLGMGILLSWGCQKSTPQGSSTAGMNSTSKADLARPSPAESRVAAPRARPVTQAMNPVGRTPRPATPSAQTSVRATVEEKHRVRKARQGRKKKQNAQLRSRAVRSMLGKANDEKASAPPPVKRGSSEKSALLAPKSSGDKFLAETKKESREAKKRPPKKPKREAKAKPKKQLVDEKGGWGEAIYLSNDDSMSLSSAQRIAFAIRNQQRLPLEHIRAHELLNYYRFGNLEVPAGKDFRIQAALAPNPKKKHGMTLALLVQGRRVTHKQRRLANLTLVVDVSGSMRAEGRMNYLKKGLRRMLTELKTGDVVNVVSFNQSARLLLEGFRVGISPKSRIDRVFRKLSAGGGTNLYAGLKKGYEVALRSQKSKYNNRVVLISDARTNTGITDPRMIALVGRNYNKAGVRLSGIGVGSDFNDALLDRLTERSQGAYLFLGSSNAVERVFGEGFVSLLETIAEDVHFRLFLPPSMRMKMFYGEAASTVKSDVQPIHYYAGSSQLFLQDLEVRKGKLPKDHRFKLAITYKDPTTHKSKREEVSFRIGDIMERNMHIVHKARAVMAYVQTLETCARDGSCPSACRQGKAAFRSHLSKSRVDAELTEVKQLLHLYCRTQL